MDRSRSRAQLILVVGVGIAVTFVALALILNTVIYTENLSTRQSVDGQDAIVFERTAEEGVGGLVSQLNYYDYGSYDGLHRSVERSTASWDNQSAWSEASRGTAVSVDIVGVTNGSHVLQESDRAFTSAGGSASWTLASGVSATRRFRMNVTRSSLKDADGIDSILTKAYTVTVSDGTNAWKLNVYEEGGDVVLEVQYPNGTTAKGCRYAKSRVSIDVTGGTVEGQECDLLKPFADGVSKPYSISYENADQVSGKYTFIVDEPLSQLDQTPYSGSVGTDPYVVGAIYDVTLNLSVEGEVTTYTSTVQVAPERPAGGESYDVYTNRRELVYVSSSTGLLSSVHPDGTITRYDVSGAQAIGPKEFDLDGDNLKEIPYVNSSGYLKTIDANNETQTLATSAATSKTLLGVGAWRGETAVYYSNTSDSSYIYRVNWTSGTPDAPSKVLVGGNGVSVSAVAGPADYNDDGDADLIYTGTSQGVYYIDGDNTHSVGRGVGQNNGIGIGAPRQHDGAGLVRVPMVDGSQNVALLNYQNDKKALTSSNVAAKAPVAGINWVGGRAKEVVFIDAGTQELYYVTLGGSIQRIETENGPVTVQEGPGVA